MAEMDGVTTVHSRYYQLSSNYHKLKGEHASYYREALRYLGCVKLADIPGICCLDEFTLVVIYKCNLFCLLYSMSMIVLT